MACINCFGVGTGVIKLACEKISVLIQATLSNFEIAPQGPPQLNLDVDRIFIVGQRVANFLLEIVAHKDMQPAVSAERFAQVRNRSTPRSTWAGGRYTVRLRIVSRAGAPV